MIKKNILLVMAILLISISCTDENPLTLDSKACFNYSPDIEIKAGDEISFTSCSENATTFGWDFGDGDISTEENPKHSYETAGDYTVKLIAVNETNADTISKVIAIQSSNQLNINDNKYEISDVSIYENPEWEPVDGVMHKGTTIVISTGQIPDFTEDDDLENYFEESDNEKKIIFWFTSLNGIASGSISKDNCSNFDVNYLDWDNYTDKGILEINSNNSISYTNSTENISFSYNGVITIKYDN